MNRDIETPEGRRKRLRHARKTEREELKNVNKLSEMQKAIQALAPAETQPAVAVAPPPSLPVVAAGPALRPKGPTLPPPSVTLPPTNNAAAAPSADPMPAAGPSVGPMPPAGPSVGPMPPTGPELSPSSPSLPSTNDVHTASLGPSTHSDAENARKVKKVHSKQAKKEKKKKKEKGPKKSADGALLASDSEGDSDEEDHFLKRFLRPNL
eukprot:GEMP01044964.1.p1 GENE.GEMP01044964.1~~GEMP01044964.1.p1  ORF type:complete len:216 (+),score=59.80 GEMP01044964.1:22-648(+)